MPTARSGLLSGFLILAALCAASAGNVLFIITPGPPSHMYGMRKLALEVASRQHNVLVGFIAVLSATLSSFLFSINRRCSVKGKPPGLYPPDALTSEQLIDQFRAQVHRVDPHGRVREAENSCCLQLLAAAGEAAKLESTGIPVLSYTVPHAPGSMDASHIQDGRSLLAGVIMATRIFVGACDFVIGNASIMARLQEFRADVMVATSMNPCAQVLASKLDKSFVNYFPAGPIDPFFTTIYPDSNRRAFMPNPLSYNPQGGSVIASQHMTFLQRLWNVGSFLHFIAADYIYLRPITASLYNRHGVNLAAPQEMRRLIMHVVSADFAMEWVRPMPPNVKLVGPLLPEPPKALPTDIEAFLESSGEGGVLYVAMGTLATLGVGERKAMAASFAALPAKVLWRLASSEVPDEAAIAELGIGNNTKVLTWAPQNDVLGHPGVRAFLSHCGANSMYEAAYHGVPIVGLPFFADQPANADKIVAKGMGVSISHKDIFTPAFREAIRKVLQDPSYRVTAELISRKLRARKRTPVQEAVDWVEHALETDVEPYLRTPEEELSFIVRHNIDVNACIAGASSGLLYVLWQIGRLAGNRLLNRSSKVKDA